MISDDDHITASCYCRFDATDWKTCTGQFLLLLIFSVIAVLLVLSIKKSIKLKTYQQTKLIYIMLMLYIATIIIRTILGVISYLGFMIDTNSSIQTIKQLSAVYYLLDKTVSFLLHTVMIIIPCSWLKNSLDCLENQIIYLQANHRTLISKSYKILNMLLIYRRFRLIYLLIFLAAFIILLIGEKQGCKFLTYTIFITLFESFLLIFIYSYGFWTLSSIKELLHITLDDFKTLRFQYMILILCCIIRLSYNFVFFFVNPFGFSYNPEPNCVDQDESFSTYRSLMISFATILMHILPCMTIIYIYWRSNAKIQKNSILQKSQTNTEDLE